MFCDDIRMELGGKFSLMGIYSRELILPMQPPVLIPKFGVVVWLICDIDDLPASASVALRALPGHTEIFHADMDLDAEIRLADDDVRKMSYGIQFQVSPLRIAAAGVIEVFVETELGAMRAGRLQIRVDEAAPKGVSSNGDGPAL